MKRKKERKRKTVTNLDSILKSRDITLLTKVHIVKIMVFPVVSYGCESWTIKMAERQRIDAFEPWCWRRHSRVPWTARRSNRSIRDKTQIHPTEHRHWFCARKPGNLHKVLVQSHPLGIDPTINRNYDFLAYIKETSIIVQQRISVLKIHWKD